MNKEVMDALMGIEDMELRTTIAGYIIAQDYVIQQLKEKLKKAIIPKFKIGQKVWYIHEVYEFSETKGYYLKKQVEERTIAWYKVCKNNNISYRCRNGFMSKSLLYYENQLFETEEEAEAKLKELEC